MSVEVDYAGVLAYLRGHDDGGIPLRIEPLEDGVLAYDLRTPVEAALGVAFQRAFERSPQDQTWSHDVSAFDTHLHTELEDGPGTEEEITAWLTDFATALQTTGTRVWITIDQPPAGLPDFDDWRFLPRQPSAFLRFVARNHLYPGAGNPVPRIPDPVIAEAMPPLAGWLHLPGGTGVVFSGAPHVVDRRQLREALTTHLPEDQYVSAFEFTATPPRMRLLHLGNGAEVALQVLDLSRTPLENYTDLLDGLRIAGPHLIHGYARLGRPAGPHEQDLSRLDAPPRPAWERASLEGKWARTLLGDYAPDAWAAQVLTRSHLDKAHDLTHWTIEALPHQRYLVTTNDPEPWLTGHDPDPDLRSQARADFGDMLLTPQALFDRTNELLAANGNPPRTDLHERPF